MRVMTRLIKTVEIEGQPMTAAIRYRRVQFVRACEKYLEGVCDRLVPRR